VLLKQAVLHRHELAGCLEAFVQASSMIPVCLILTSLGYYCNMKTNRVQSKHFGGRAPCSRVESLEWIIKQNEEQGALRHGQNI
jgi:hypothetical protein